MGSHSRKQYTADLSGRRLHLLFSTGLPWLRPRKNLGVNVGLLSRWKIEIGQQGAGAFPGRGHVKVVTGDRRTSANNCSYDVSHNITKVDSLRNHINGIKRVWSYLKHIENSMVILKSEE